MEQFVPLFQAVIAFVAVLGGFSFAVDLIVRPLKKDVAGLEKDIARLESDIHDLKNGQKEILSKLQQAS